MSSKPRLTRPQERLFRSHVAAGEQTAEAARRVAGRRGLPAPTAGPTFLLADPLRRV